MGDGCSGVNHIITQFRPPERTPFTHNEFAHAKDYKHSRTTRMMMVMTMTPAYTSHQRTGAAEQDSWLCGVVDDGVDGGARMNEWMSPAPILNLIFAEHNHPLIRTHNTMHTLDNWHTTTTRAEDSIETLVVLTGYNTRTRINNYFNFPANRRRPQEEGDAVGFGGDSPTI